LIYDDSLVVILRDNTPNMRSANTWEFPGGCCENSETPWECPEREVKEELDITLNPKMIQFKMEHPSIIDPEDIDYFFVVGITRTDIRSIKFGDEGQEWRYMPIDEFLQHTDVVPEHKERLQLFLDR
tara:strand:- start:2013 stop:2393 length:381 start_codon:yes stop_codon:yes gene_type:complete